MERELATALGAPLRARRREPTRGGLWERLARRRGRGDLPRDGDRESEAVREKEPPSGRAPESERDPERSSSEEDRHGPSSARRTRGRSGGGAGEGSGRREEGREPPLLPRRDPMGRAGMATRGARSRAPSTSPAAPKPEKATAGWGGERACDGGGAAKGEAKEEKGWEAHQRCSGMHGSMAPEQSYAAPNSAPTHETRSTVPASRPMSGLSKAGSWELAAEAAASSSSSCPGCAAGSTPAAPDESTSAPTGRAAATDSATSKSSSENSSTIVTASSTGE